MELNQSVYPKNMSTNRVSCPKNHVTKPVNITIYVYICACMCTCTDGWMDISNAPKLTLSSSLHYIYSEITSFVVQNDVVHILVEIRNT